MRVEPSFEHGSGLRRTSLWASPRTPSPAAPDLPVGFAQDPLPGFAGPPPTSLRSWGREHAQKKRGASKAPLPGCAED